MALLGMAALGVALLGMAMLAACTGSAVQAAPPAAESGATESAPTVAAPAVSGVVAIGHSGLTGFATDPDAYQASLNSWATGTRVASVWARLRAVDPGRAGRAVLAAVPGSTASSLDAQAVQAFVRVPRPWLVVVQTMENDVRCDDTEAAGLRDFRRGLADALRYVGSSSPGTRILVVGPVGDPLQRARVQASDPAARVRVAGSLACDIVRKDGAVDELRAVRYSQILNLYAGEAKDVCAAVAQCRYEGDAPGRFRFTSADLVPGEWQHLSVTGQARLAATLWPTVARVLGIRG